MLDRLFFKNISWITTECVLHLCFYVTRHHETPNFQYQIFLSIMIREAAKWVLITSLVNPKQKMGKKNFFMLFELEFSLVFWIHVTGQTEPFHQSKIFISEKKTDSRSKCWHFLVIPGGFCLKLYKLRHGVPPPLPPGPPPWRSSPPSSVTVEMNIFVAMLIRLDKFDGSQIKFIKIGVFLSHNSTDNKIFDPFLSLLRHDHVF